MSLVKKVTNRRVVFSALPKFQARFIRGAITAPSAAAYTDDDNFAIELNRFLRGNATASEQLKLCLREHSNETGEHVVWQDCPSCSRVDPCSDCLDTGLIPWEGW